MNEDLRNTKQTEPTTQKNSRNSSGAENTAELHKKLRFSRILSLVLAGLLIFVGGSYAALLWQQSDGDQIVTAPENIDPDAPGGQTPNGDGGAAEQPPMPDVIRADADDYMALGDVNAPVTLLEWTDFTCPYCGVFNRETLPTLIEDYIDTGKVRLEVHDVTYIGPEAEDAATAARAAGMQDKYFEYLFAVYELGADDNKPDLSQESLFAVAQQIGLDQKKFKADFEGEELRAKVQQSTILAKSIGVTGVPFFVGTTTGSLENTQPLSGAQPAEQFKQYLDNLIAEAK